MSRTQFLQQAHTSVTPRNGPTKPGVVEQRKENKGSQAKPDSKRVQRDPTRAFGTNITNRNTRTAIRNEDNSIEFAYFSEKEFREESPLDRLDLQRIKQPCDYKKR